MPTQVSQENQLRSWDPLEGQLPSEIVSATIKRQIKNILKSYTGWFDPFAELIQNALDALEHRTAKGEQFEPTIWIDINLRDNTLSVTDNGIGFLEDQFKSFLAPNVSFKAQTERGNKGVGATYLAYGFNFLQVGTKTPDFTYIGTIKSGREWLEDDKGIQTRPKIQQETKCAHEVFGAIDRGSSFTLKLMGDFIRPKKLNWIGATTAEQWQALLRIQTPLGGIYQKAARPLKKWHLKVTDENGNMSDLQSSACDYLYPHTVISACEQQENISKAQMELVKKGKDASRLPDKFYNLNGLYNLWTLEDFTTSDKVFFGKLSPTQLELVKQYKIFCYGFFGYSTEIWDFYNDSVLGVRKGERVLRGGVQLATNSMPQGEVVQIPLTRNIGYQNVCHVVVHFDGAEPDLGRKGFQPELEALAKSIAVLVVNFFLGWRRHLKKETGAPPDIVAGKNLHDWIVDQEAHEKQHPLVIVRKDVFLPTMQPPLTSLPLNEQDVVALFNQLLAGGVIRGVRLMSSSTFNQYDAICRLQLKAPIANHIYDKDKNPLGIEGSQAAREFQSEPRVLEYKYSFDALVEEFEKEIKSEKELHLVVAWEMGDRWKERYEVTSLLDYANLHHRFFHGGTHLLKSSNTGQLVFPAIILSELVEFINDPDKVQAVQKARYEST